MMSAACVAATITGLTATQWRNYVSYYDDIYEEEMDWREKEWDEPGPDFGKVVLRNRRTHAMVFAEEE